MKIRGYEAKSKIKARIPNVAKILADDELGRLGLGLGANGGSNQEFIVTVRLVHE